MGFRNLQEKLKYCDKMFDVPFQNNKGRFSSERISNLVKFAKKCTKSLQNFNDFEQLFEYGTKDKIHSKIKPAPLQQEVGDLEVVPLEK